MEDDIDIYEDLPSFEARDEEKYKVEIKELSEKCNNLQQENSELKLKVDELSKNNKILSDNLSSLLKTAKAEIARKDRMITDLRQQHDNMAFRRKGYAKPRPPKAPGKPARDNTYIPFVAPPLYQTPNFEIAPPLYQTPDFEIAPPLYQTPDFEIDDTEQVYEPEKVANTVFGERLRKKILLEEELERAQKEEAKLAALENKAPPVKAEVELIEENRIETHIVKKETETQIVKKETETPIVKKVPEEKSNGFLEQAVVSEKSSGISSISSTLPSHEEDDRNLWDRRDLRKNLFSKRMNDEAAYPEQKRRRMEDERYHSDDSRYYNDNVKHESRFNLEKSDNCPSRDSAKVMHRRRSNNREEVERKREFHGERSKSNHRSRSKSPPQDRRLVEKRADRHRTDKYRAYMDKYEKRRRSGNNKKNDFSKNFGKDLRATIENKFQRKVGGRSEYDDYKNSKFGKDSRRGSRESPPSEKSRSCSSGRVRGKADDKRRARPSKSSDRLVNAKNTEKTRKELKTVKTRSKDRKSKVAERMNLDTEIKLEKSPRTSAEKELNRQIASASALDAFAPLPNLDAAPEELKKHPKRVRKKSKELTLAEMKDCRSESKSQISSRMSSEKEGSNKLLASSALLSDTSEKNLTNKQHVSTTKSGKGARSKSKELTVAEMKDHDSESKSQTQLRTVSEKEITKKELTSTTLLPDCLASLSESVAKTKSKELSVDKESDAEPKSEKLSSTTCEKEATNKQHVSSELLPDDSKKEVANKQVISIALLPEDLASLPQSDMMPENPKEREGSREISKETTVAEENDSQPKSRAGSSSEKEMRNKPLASSAISFEVCEKNVINKQFVPETSLLEGLASFPESNAVPEDLQKLRKGARRKSKELTPSEQKDSESTSSTQAGANFEKEVMDKQLVSTAPLPDGSASSTESSEISKDIQKQCETARGKPKEPVVAKEKERNSGQYKSRDRSRTRTKLSSEREIQNTLLDSSELLSENSEKNVKNYDGSAKTLSEGFVLLQESDAELKKECRGARNKSTEATVVEEKDRDSEPTSQTRSRTSSERQVTNKQITSSKPFSEDSEKKMTNYELLPANPLLEGLVSVPESDAELKKQRRGSTSKSKEATIVEEKDRNSEPKSQTRSRTSSEIEVTNKQLASSELLSEDSEKKVTNCELLPANPLSEGLVSLLESDAELKNQRRDATRKSKEATVVEEKDRDSEPTSQTRSRTSSERQVTNKQITSSKPFSEDSEKKMTNYELLPANPLLEGLVSVPESDAELKKQRRGSTSKSKEATIVEEKDRNSEPKSQTRSRTSSERQVTNKQITSSKPFSEDSEKKMTNYELLPANPLLEGLVSVPESDAELKKQRRGSTSKSKEATIVEEKDRNSEPKSQTRSRTSSERQVTNKQITSSKPFSEDSEKKMTNYELLPANPLLEGLVSVPESDAELKKQRRGSTSKSKEATIVEEKDRNSEPKSQTRSRTSSEIEVTNKQLASSELLSEDSEKKVTYYELVPANPLSEGLVSSKESDGELKKERRNARRKSKEATVVEEKDHDLEPKSQTRPRTSSEREVTNKQLASSELLSEDSAKKVTNCELLPANSLSEGLVSSKESDAELKKERRNVSKKSKEATVVEEKDHDLESKSQTRPRTISEEEVTNKELASSALLQLASALLPKQRKSARRRSKDSETTVVKSKDQASESKSQTLSRLSSEKELTKKQLASSALLPGASEKDARNNQDISIIPSPLPESNSAPDELRKESKGARRKSKDPKRRIAKENDQDSEPKFQTPSRTSSEEEITNEKLASCVPEAVLLTLNLESKRIPDTPKDPNGETRKSPTATLQNVVNQFDSPGKWLSSVLENDTEVTSLSSEILEPSDIGSRSFREEKIENIEKFIQNYQDDENLYCQNVKGDTGELDSETISCISNTSILDTLTMETEVGKPEDDALNNSIMSEQLLLDSLLTPIKKTSPPLPTILPPYASKQPPLPLMPHPDEKKQDLSPDTKKQPPSLLPDTINKKSPGRKQQASAPVPFSDTTKPLMTHPSLDSKTQQSSPSPDTKNRVILSSSESKRQSLLPLPSSNMEKQILPPPPSSESKSLKLPTSDMKNQPLPPPRSSDTKIEALPTLLSSDKKQEIPTTSPDIKNQAMPTPTSADAKEQPLPLLPSSETKEKALPPLPPTPDTKKQPLPPLPPTPDTKQQPLPPLPPTPDTKQQPLPPLPPTPDTKQQPLPPLPPTPDTKQQPLPPLSSSDPKEQPLPLLPSSETKEKALPLPFSETKEKALPLPSSETKEKSLPLPSSETKEKALPLPSSEIKEKALPSLPPTPDAKKQPLPPLPPTPDTKQQPLPPSPPTSDMKKQVLPPLPSPDTREKTLPPLPSTPDTKKQALPPLSPSPGVAETHMPLLASDTEKRQSLPSLLCTNERSELSSPSLPSAVEKKVLPATPEEKTKPSVLLAPEEKQDLPLLSITPPEDKTKTRLLPELASSEKENLSPISVPENITKSVLRSSLDSTEKKGHSSQLPASNETNNATSKLPIDKVEEESLSKVQTSLEMDSTPEMEASSETKDFSSQLSASSEKEESLSKLQTSLEKKDSTSEMEASNERKVSSSQLPASTDKNLEISVTQQISASLEPEKTRAQKVAMKQIRRHKIPCTPIVSRYSRKRRDLVLTDSQASQCVIKPDSPSDTQTNNNAKVAITVSHVFKKEAAIILKRVVSPKSDDNPSEQSNNNDNSKIERPEKLSKAVNGSSPENERKIYSKTPNGTPELRKTDKTDSHSEIDPATIPGEEIPNSEPEKNEEELQPQLESKAALPKMQNPEAGSKFEKPISAKPVEIRGKRTALKTIAPPDPDGDVIGASTSRKRPLPKEKENESKQIAKQCKIMVVARRRRPVHLEDSSSATTLVPSAEDTNFDEPLKNNSVKNTLNSEKPELVQPVAERASKRRKRRSADNLST